jgi:recombination protein RecA
VRKQESLKTGGETYGNHIKCKVVKNKVAPPFKVAEFDILYGKGISKSSEIIEIGVELDILEKSGSWFSYKGERLGQGKENTRKYIESHPALMQELEDLIKAKKDDIDLSLSETYELDDDDEDDDDDFNIKLLDISGDDE